MTRTPNPHRCGIRGSILTTASALACAILPLRTACAEPAPPRDVSAVRTPVEISSAQKTAIAGTGSENGGHSARSGDGKDRAPEAVLRPLSREVLDEFMRGVYHAIPTDFKMLELPSTGSKELQEFWVGNPPRFRSTLEHVELDLVVAARGDELPEVPFKLAFDISQESVKVTRSQVLPGQRERIGMPFRTDKTTKLFFEGPNRTSFLLVTPPRGEGGTPAGLLVCPREFPAKMPDTLKRGAAITLANPGVTIDRMSASFTGSGTLEISSFTNRIDGKMVLGSTYDVAPSKGWIDEDHANSILLNIEYLPIEGFRFMPRPRAYEVKAASGIKFDLDLQNSVGYRRTTTYEHGVWLDRVNYDPEISLNVRRLRAQPGEGECFRFVFRQILEHRYERTAP